MLLPCGLKINIAPVKLEDIPSEEKIIQAGRELIEDTNNWKHTKNYAKGTVKGLVRPKDSDDEEPWFCRASIHTSEEATFDELWFGLGTNKAEHESKFVTTIDKTTLLKRISDNASIWNLHYKFNPPISNRTFTVLQVTHLDTSGPNKSGIIVSIPIDVSSDAEMSKAELRGARGRYCAVERLLELEDGKTEWRMAASNTPGGSIPAFIVHASVPGQIANDVPLFFKWLKSDREYFKKGVELGREPEPAAASNEPPVEGQAQPAPDTQPRQTLV